MMSQKSTGVFLFVFFSVFICFSVLNVPLGESNLHEFIDKPMAHVPHHVCEHPLPVPQHPGVTPTPFPQRGRHLFMAEAVGVYLAIRDQQNQRMFPQEHLQA